jgi:hypothetical protein
MPLRLHPRDDLSAENRACVAINNAWPNGVFKSIRAGLNFHARDEPQRLSYVICKPLITWHSAHLSCKQNEMSRQGENIDSTLDFAKALAPPSRP